MTIDAAAQRMNQEELQAQSLHVIAAFVGPIGFAWLMGSLWPITGKHIPPAGWLSSLLLFFGPIAGYLLSRHHLRLGSYFLCLTLLGAAAFAVLASHSPHLIYLLILPITFAGVLLGISAVLPLGGAACMLSALLGALGLHLDILSADLWLPVVIMILVSVSSWLSARNLYTALAWVWSGYERAHHNELLARRQEGDLRRALKALDEATYRLERTNYMLALARDQAEEARRLKQQFAQTISHELRTPLNLIVGFTELMAQSPDYYESQLSPAFVRDLSIVYRNACHLQKLVNDVLDLARIEAARMTFVPEEIGPDALVQEAVNTARSLVESHGLKLRVEIEPGLPQLWVDPTRIRQVLFNLLNNAERFTERGSITVSVCRAGEEIIFSVADTGVGIAPADVPRLFEEFQQLDGTTHRRYGGAGLGLVISRQFVELHGGRIWVESRPGQGSTFSFSLPIARQDAIEGHNERPAEPLTPAPAGSQDGHILLAVTRSPSAAMLLRRYVRDCRTVVVQDLEQARNAAAQVLPQVVIIDTTHQGLDAAALRALGQAWALPHCSFIACPLPGEEPIRQRLQVDGYLVKPITRQDLWDALRRFGEGIDRVLIIDDDVDFARLVTRLLDSPLRRYQVLSAHSAREGIELMQRQRPDLLLLDLKLPDMDGVQVIERLRGDPAWAGLPIVVVSAQEEIDTLEALNGGMVIAKSSGLNVGEAVQWIQQVVNTATQISRPYSTEHNAR